MRRGWVRREGVSVGRGRSGWVRWGGCEEGGCEEWMGEEGRV